MKHKKFYSKLQREKYTTIRRNLEGKKKGDIETESFNQKIWYAKIINIKKMPLAQIDWNLLIHDCLPFAESRKECYKLFQSCYEEPIDFENEPFYIFYMQKVKTLNGLTNEMKEITRIQNKIERFCNKTTQIIKNTEKIRKSLIDKYNLLLIAKCGFYEKRISSLNKQLGDKYGI